MGKGTEGEKNLDALKESQCELAMQSEARSERPVLGGHAKCGLYQKSMGNYLKDLSRDFPGGPVVKNPPYNAGDAGSIPGQGTKIPHTAGQLSLQGTTTELMCLNQSPCKTTEAMGPGACAPQLERSPRTTMKSLRAATKDPPCRN